MGFNHRKGKGELEKSKTSDREDLKKNQCVFWKEEWHWKIDCQKLKPKKKESTLEANIAQAHSNISDSSDNSLSINSIDCWSEESEWTLDTGATYHICLKTRVVC